MVRIEEEASARKKPLRCCHTVVTQVEGRCYTAAAQYKIRCNRCGKLTVSATGLAMFLAVARYVTLGHDFCTLSRNGVARQRITKNCTV